MLEVAQTLVKFIKVYRIRRVKVEFVGMRQTVLLRCKGVVERVLGANVSISPPSFPLEYVL